MAAKAPKPSKKQRGKAKASAKAKVEAKNKHIKFNDAGDATKKNGVTLKKKRARATKDSADAEEKTEGGGKADRSPEAIQSAKYYLEQWKARNEPKPEGEVPWKFKKIKQQWILRWMYEADVVPKAMFALVLEYLGGLQGLARQRVLEDAHKVIDAGEPAKAEEGEEDMVTKLARRRFKRALQMAELLS
ncbi:TPA: hypothetical protein N0F65_011662 [Lagenidium giganteum]|uniref:WKF domain-containing protein n=1 Tax=Lagenidium giganteum TaxID=4803 RepID=A0AAV2ZDR2_9STRA|nr:TPA: hypothetical protein N0F65_011662 [Lagenidium giganteum]